LIKSKKLSNTMNKLNYVFPLILFVYLVVFLTLDYGRTSGNTHWLLIWIDSFPYGDKFMHFMRSFVLSGLVACNSYLFFNQFKSFYLILSLCLFVTSLEVSQLFIDSREFSFFDLGVELLGVLVGFCLSKLILAFYFKRKYRDN